MPANPLNVDDFGGELFNLGMSPEARPLLEAVKTFIVEEVQPMSVEFFALGADRQDLDTRRAFQRLEECHGGRMPCPAAEERPRLSPDVAARHESAVGVGPQERRCLIVPRIAPVAQGDPERRVDEDHP